MAEWNKRPVHQPSPRLAGISSYFKFEADDMQAIAKLDIAYSLIINHYSGETAKQFMKWKSVVKPTE